MIFFRYNVLIYYAGPDPALRVKNHISANAVITALAITIDSADDTLNSKTDERYT
jgi:hypothetical protein